MRSDDLAPLLAPDPGDPTAIRGGKGTVVAWDPETGENVIRFRGANLVNLPIVASNSEAALMRPGDEVMLHIFGAGGLATIHIVGRVTKPGTPQAVSWLAAVAGRIVAASDPDAGTRTGTAGVTYNWGDLTGAAVGPEVPVTIGPSGKALVFFSAEFSWGAPVADGVSAFASVAVSGATTIAASGLWALGPSQAPVNEAIRLAAGRHKLFENLNPGSTTFTMKYTVHGPNGNGAPTATIEEREIAVFAL